MRHQNGVLQDRNIFVMDGQVMAVVRYHKSQSQWDKPKEVPLFLPWRLGLVIAIYLAYLQRFREYLIVQVLGAVTISKAGARSVRKHCTVLRWPCHTRLRLHASPLAC